jgi:hypothetical protein
VPGANFSRRIVTYTVRPWNACDAAFFLAGGALAFATEATPPFVPLSATAVSTPAPAQIASATTTRLRSAIAGTYPGQLPVRAGCEHTFAVTFPAYIREKALRLRIERQLTIDEIADRLAISRTTAYEWVGHVPVPRRSNPHPGTLAMQARYQRARDEAYARGAAEYARLASEPTFRDFVTLFIAEGTKRDRNKVSVANSDPAVISVCTGWLRRLTDRRLCCSVQVHEDQDLDAVRNFWAGLVHVRPDEIRLLRKSNSGRLRGRTWRSEHGVLTVWCNDTLLRARVQAWVDEIRSEWLTLSDPGA